MASIADFDVKKLDHRTTLKIKVKATRQLKIRVKIAMFLMKTAARILGCGIKIETDSVTKY